MHFRNPFKIPPDFKSLGEKYSDFEAHLIKKTEEHSTINFKNAVSLRSLTCTLARHYFNLTLDIPTDRLIPTLPLRINYLLWIDDLLSYRKRDSVIGIDIGTGSSAIYPLLGARLFHYHFLATETDPVCCTSAEGNVRSNKAAVRVMLVDSTKDKLRGNIGANVQYDFCLCNPPFFEGTADMLGSAKSADRPPPKSICTATPAEVITPGGEECFISSLISESLELGSQVTWYTSMVGKKGSLEGLLDRLAGCGVSRVVCTELKQGKTSRWALGWSLTPTIPLLLHPTSKKINTTYSFTCNTTSIPTLLTSIKRTCSLCHVTLQECGALSPQTTREWCGWLGAGRDTWSHGRRKRRRLLRSGGEGEVRTEVGEEPQSPSLSQDGECLFYCLMTLENQGETISVDFNWIFGMDKDSLNQFCCFLAKKVLEDLE